MTSNSAAFVMPATTVQMPRTHACTPHRGRPGNPQARLLEEAVVAGKGVLVHARGGEAGEAAGEQRAQVCGRDVLPRHGLVQQLQRQLAVHRAGGRLHHGHPQPAGTRALHRALTGTAVATHKEHLDKCATQPMLQHARECLRRRPGVEPGS